MLMEMMEAQESIEEAEMAEQFTALKEQNQERIEETLKLLDDAFSNGNAEAARKECIRLRYPAEGLNACLKPNEPTRVTTRLYLPGHLFAIITENPATCLLLGRSVHLA